MEVVWAGDDEQAKCWVEPLGKCLTLPCSSASCIDFAPSGRLVAVVRYMMALGIIDIVQNRGIVLIGGPISKCCFSPDSQLIAYDVGGVLAVRSLKSQDYPVVYMSPNDVRSPITTICFSSDSKKVLVAGEYRTLQLHSVEQEKGVIASFGDDEARTWGCAISRDDSLVASALSSKKLIIWDANTGKLKKQIRTAYVPRSCSFTSDNQVVVSTASMKVERFDLKGNSNLKITLVERGPGSDYISTVKAVSSRWSLHKDSSEVLSSSSSSSSSSSIEVKDAGGDCFAVLSGREVVDVFDSKGQKVAELKLKGVIGHMGGRRLDMSYDWSIVRLLWIAREEKDNIFSRLPAELIKHIAEYCVVDNLPIQRAIARQEKELAAAAAADATKNKKRRNAEKKQKMTERVDYPWNFESIVTHEVADSDDEENDFNTDSDSD
eukprot:TRINITY_DN11806_c0_g1_i1.p1 TRINITY_DN11806_c0_g1~~TRINITY_DN11806_c0_g1_i1.p1  ORF type:complete len:435 (-),score=100.01 TRINITY_DN11806_c0_g1_i1:290-1594(-)